MKEAKKAPPLCLLDRRIRDKTVRLAFAAAHLKHLYRQGWLMRGIPRPLCESVAEHSYSVAFLAAALAPRLGLDAGRAVLLAILHDAAETHAGDITPAEGVTKENKFKLELAAAQRLFGPFPGGRRLLALWREYENGRTPEARFVRELDKLEMAVQASVYSLTARMDPTEFHRSAIEAVKTPLLRRILKQAVAAAHRPSTRRRLKGRK